MYGSSNMESDYDLMFLNRDGGGEKLLQLYICAFDR